MPLADTLTIYKHEHSLLLIHGQGLSRENSNSELDWFKPVPVIKMTTNAVPVKTGN